MDGYLSVEPARGFRQCEHEAELDDGGERGDAEHPPPRPRRLGEGEVDEVGQELAAGDEEAVGADERAADPGGRRLGDVERGGHGGHADAEADEDAAHHELRGARGRRHHRRAREEEGVGHQDRRPPPEPVRGPPADGRADDRAGHRHAHDHFLHGMARSSVSVVCCFSAPIGRD
uniref:Uncharacterized protein n=1 Tax=Zea mays TaxID=4577 RepID=C4J6X9_MAIZE|nr:unknown [Zea mays]